MNLPVSDGDSHNGESTVGLGHMNFQSHATAVDLLDGSSDACNRTFAQPPVSMEQVAANHLQLLQEMSLGATSHDHHTQDACLAYGHHCSDWVMHPQQTSAAIAVDEIRFHVAKGG